MTLDGTPHLVASHLGLFSLSLSHKKDARLILVKEHKQVYSDSAKTLPGGGGGGGGYLLPCSSEIKWLVPVPEKSKICFLCSLFPNIVFVPLFPLKIRPLFPCSLEINALEINALVPLFPKNP